MYGGTLYGAVVDTAEPNMLVQIQSGGSWVDVTCDVRSINTDRGRSSYLEANTAGTMDLVLANFQGLYSGWNPYGLWANANPYRTNLPIQIVVVQHATTYPLFTGTTDSVIDTWPGTVDAQAEVQATDGMKLLTRHTGNPRALVGDNELTGARINRLADDGAWTGARAIDAGTVALQPTDLSGVTLDVMRLIGETEWGVLYVDRSGTLVFRQRDAVQTDPRQVNVQWTLTDDDVSVPGICYSDIVLPVSDDHVVNVAQITPPGLAQSVAQD